MEIKNKVVVITGAGSGLGKALVKECIARGAVVVGSVRTKEEFEEMSKEQKIFTIITDVSHEDQVAHLAHAVIQKFGHIDIWMNNAGIWIPHAPIEELDFSRVHDMIEVNLFGVMYGSKAALLQMKKQHSGTIVNILSTSALEGRAGSSGYCASKYAAVGFTKSLRLEASPWGIAVVAIYPGGMRTHLFDEKQPMDFEKFMDPAVVAEKIIENFEKEHPEEELIIKRS